MRPLLRALTALLLGLLLFAACSESQTLDITGETHFLKACRADVDECGTGLACVCGSCTRSCEVSQDCAGLPRAECVAAGSTADASCVGSAPAAHCDARCASDGDCAAISRSHRCELGYCRAGATGASGGGAGGGTGAAGASSAGGDGPGGAGADDCTYSGLDGNQVVVLGDTFMALTHEVTAGLEELALASGALASGQSYRDESTAGNNALAAGGNGILGQYLRAADVAPVSVIITNGGGADVLAATCEQPPSASCEALAAAAAGARDFFARAAEDGVSHILYAFYPNPIDEENRATMDALRPMIQTACEESPAPCHFVDLRPVFEGHYAEYITSAGINPTSAGSAATAAAIWATMRQYCIAP